MISLTAPEGRSPRLREPCPRRRGAAAQTARYSSFLAAYEDARRFCHGIRVRHYGPDLSRIPLFWPALWVTRRGQVHALRNTPGDTSAPQEYKPTWSCLLPGSVTAMAGVPKARFRTGSLLTGHGTGEDPVPANCWDIVAGILGRWVTSRIQQLPLILFSPGISGRWPFRGGRQRFRIRNFWYLMRPSPVS